MNIDEINDRTVYTVVCRRLAALLSFVTTETSVVIVGTSRMCAIIPASISTVLHITQMRNQHEALEQCHFTLVSQDTDDTLPAADLLLCADFNVSVYPHGAAWLKESLATRYQGESPPETLQEFGLIGYLAYLAAATKAAGQEIALLVQQMEKVSVSV